MKESLSDAAPGNTSDVYATPGWRRSLRLGLFLWLVYFANLNTLGAGDTNAATFLPVALIRGDGVFLDRFESHVRDPNGRMQLEFTPWRGHVIPLYPLAPGLILAPLEWPQVWVLDRVRPGWEQSPRGRLYLEFLAKNSAALLTAVTTVVLLHLLTGLGVGSAAALAAAVAAGLGSSLWTIASQAPWQHGPAALAIVLMAWLLAVPAVSNRRAFLAGCAGGLLIAVRMLDGTFTLAAAAWIAWRHPRRLVAFLVPACVLAGLVVGVNLLWFGSPVGGQAILESLHPKLHATAGPWSGHLFEGALGTLLSPSRGLLVYSPWVILALAYLPLTVRRLSRKSVVVWLLAALAPLGLLLSKYSVWWGGHCFGARYWTEAIPLLTVPLAIGLDRALALGRRATAPFAVTIAAAIVTQAIGAACYPSTWYTRPSNIDQHHERLWSWRDSELTRCLAEGPNFRLRRVMAELGLVNQKPAPTSRLPFATIPSRE